MHPNHQAPDMSYAPGDLTASNTLIDALSAALLPAAERAFQAAALRQSAEAGADTLAGEALSALHGILSELHDHTRLDAEMRRLSAGLADALANSTEQLASWELADMRLWLHGRAMDLARAVATFWVNLGDDIPSRHAACSAFLPALARHEQGMGALRRQREQWELICSRFFLSPQQSSVLLDIASQHALHRATRQAAPRTAAATAPSATATTATTATAATVAAAPLYLHHGPG